MVKKRLCCRTRRRKSSFSTPHFHSKFLHNTSWILLNSLHQHQDTSLHSADHLHIAASPILHTKTYIPATHLLTRHDYACHICSALFLLRISIDDFNNKRTNRRIRSHKAKNSLITLHLLLRLRYEILKRWEHIERQSDLNNHSGLYSALDYQIRLFSMILIYPNSRTGSYGFKRSFFLIRIIILRLNAKEEAIKKSNVFAEQYAKARLEAAYKNRDKYAIMSKPVTRETRSEGDLDTSPPQPRAKSHINQAYWHSVPLRSLISSRQYTIWSRSHPKSVICNIKINKI